MLLERSTRSRSGYVNVHFDNRGCAKPWSVKTSTYRSAGFVTAREAAIHLALTRRECGRAMLHKAKIVKKPLAPPVTKKKSLTKKGASAKASNALSAAPRLTLAAPAPAKKSAPTKALVPLPAAVPAKPSAKKRVAAASATAPPLSASPAAPAAWMLKAGVKFSGSACDLFGERILIPRHPGRAPSLAVVKQWMPCAEAGFGIVFDEQPDVVLYENLMRRGRSDWKIVQWEGDEWDTLTLRPMCPQCGHPLGTGRDAWTICQACNYPEPGAASTSMLTRLRTNDPNRRARPNYSEVDSDDE